MTDSEEEVAAAKTDTPQSVGNVESNNANSQGKNNNVLHNIPTLSPCSPSTPASKDGGVNKSIYFADDHTALSMNEDFCLQEMKQRERKVDEILDCLNGVRSTSATTSSGENDADCNDDEKVVDLWHLRQLAISQHGLVNANIRKRAWPMLVGVNEHILNSSIATLPTHFSRGSGKSQEGKAKKLNGLAEVDIMMIKQDITTCVWNLEEEIKLVRNKREEEKDRKRTSGMQIVFKKDKIGEDASITSLDSGFSSITAGRITPRLIPEAIRAFPRFGPTPSASANAFVNESPNVSGSSTPVSGIATPNTLSSAAPIGIQNMSINENSDVSSTIKKSKTRYLRKRREEQALLLNIITTVLRAVPDEEEASDVDSDLGVDDDTVVADNIKKLYYFKGMHNLIAPILITLESPSLTSLVVNRLAQRHLRDAMGSTFESIQAGIRLIFMPLLEKVDKSLHDYLIKGGLKDPCVFALQWVLCWFATDVMEYDIIGRLFDLFIASHASFPVYFSVAMLTHSYNKGRIMMTPCETSALNAVIFSLPTTSFSADNIHANHMIEETIKASLSFMKSIPISALINICKRKKESNTYINALKIANSVSMFKKPPAWAFASSTSTDWTLIKQAKALRGLSPVTRSKKRKLLLARTRQYNRNMGKDFLYSTSLDASGLSAKMKRSITKVKKRHFWATKIILLVVLIAIGFSVSNFKAPAGNRQVKKKSALWIQSVKNLILFRGNGKKEGKESRKVKQRKTSRKTKATEVKQEEVKKRVTRTEKAVESSQKKVKNYENFVSETKPTDRITQQNVVGKDPTMNRIESTIGYLMQGPVEQSKDGNNNEDLNAKNSFGRTWNRIKQYLEDDAELFVITF